MPILTFEFENGRDKAPTKIEADDVATQEDFKVLQQLLKHYAILSFNDNANYSDDEQFLEKVSWLGSIVSKIDHLEFNQALPYEEIIQDLEETIDTTLGDLLLVDEETRAILSISEETPHFGFSGMPLNTREVSGLCAKYGEEFAYLAIKNDCNYFTYTAQPQPGVLKNYSEYPTLGYMEATGLFTPFVTILDDGYFRDIKS